MKIRIVKVVKPGRGGKYLIQKKILFWWNTLFSALSEDTAMQIATNLTRPISKEVVATFDSKKVKP